MYRSLDPYRDGLLWSGCPAPAAPVGRLTWSRSASSHSVGTVDLFVDNAAVFASKGEMRKLVQGGGVSLNKEKLEAFDQVITTADLLDGKYLLVQREVKK